MNNINVKEVIGSNLAVSTENGLKVFNVIVSHLDKNEPVELDFDGIIVMITAFLNSAIGSLYKDNKYSSEFLNSNLKLVNVDPNDISLFVDVVKTAKEYFSNKDFSDNNNKNSIYGKN